MAKESQHPAPMELLHVPVADLLPLSGNPRKVADPKAVTKLSKQIKEHGFQNPLNVYREADGKYTILCGNHRFQAGQKLGMAAFPCVEYKGTREAAIARAIADNKTATWTEWDVPLLQDMLEGLDVDGFDMELTGFDADELDAMLAVDEGTAGLTDPDDVPEPPAEPVTRLGDIWKLGNHRLMCGDSTSIEAVEKLMGGANIDLLFTDPPYGINIVAKNKVGGGGVTKFGKIGGGKIVEATNYVAFENDGTTETARGAYQAACAVGARNHLVWGGNYFTDFLPPSMCWVVWDKENTGNFADVELAWTSFDKAAKLYRWLWNGLSRKGDRKTEGKSRVHPTQKPVGLFEEIFKDFPGENILDLFLGSGSTLIACEKTGRACYGMELSPHYCDVIITRWENFTGQKAERVDG